jgi:integrase
VKSRRTGHGAIYKYKYKSGGRTVERWRWQLYVPVNADAPDGDLKRTGQGGFTTAKLADDALQDARQKLKNQVSFGGEKVTMERYVNQWLDGLRLEASTVYGYRKIARNHVIPYLGMLPVPALTATRLRRHYTELLDHGRKDAGHRGESLSANTVNKVHVLIGAVLDAAVDDGLIAMNPARKARTVNAPTGAQIRASRPEVQTWEASELRRFLEWDRSVFNDDLYTLWLVIAQTGCRRSEALALRWSDLDAPNQRLAIRRAADTINPRMVKSTKANGARVVDLDQDTIDALKGWKVLRGSLSLSLARADSFMFGNLDGDVRSPNEIGRRWRTRVMRAQAHYGEDQLKIITLKGLRHTHATLLLQAGVQPKVVQERLGHSNISTTMNIYSHVTPTLQRDAVARLQPIMNGA